MKRIDPKVFILPGFAILFMLVSWWSLQMANNHLVSLETLIEADKGKLDSAEITRAKLYQQLGSLLSAAVNYDETILSKITEARNVLIDGDVNRAAGMFGHIIQTYPELAAVDGFKNLRDTIELTEKNCQSLRDTLIESQRCYKKDVRSFPYTLAMKFYSYEVREDLIAADYSGYKAPDDTKNESFDFSSLTSGG